MRFSCAFPVEWGEPLIMDKSGIQGNMPLIQFANTQEMIEGHLYNVWTRVIGVTAVERVVEFRFDEPVVT